MTAPVAEAPPASRALHCYACEQYLPEDRFARDSSRSSGRMSKCAKCAGRARTRRFFAKLTPAQHAEFRKKENRRTELRRQRREHIDPTFFARRKARRSAREAAHRGLIHKPTACELCGAVERLEGHHPDARDRFRVLFVCRPCHGGLSHRTLTPEEVA